MIMSQKQVVVVTLNDEYYGININYIKEVIKPKGVTIVPNSEDYVQGVINLRGKIIVVVDLDVRLGFKPPENSDKTRIVVLDIDEEQVGLKVDSVIETIMVDRQDIQNPPEALKKRIMIDVIEGVTRQDERLITLIDAKRLFPGSDKHGK